MQAVGYAFTKIIFRKANNYQIDFSNFYEWTFILSEGIFFNIRFLSQCIVYWIYMLLHVKKHYFIRSFAWF